MIAVRAQELTTLIDRRAALREHVEQLDGFQARQKKLATLLDGLRPLVLAVETLRKRGITEIEINDRLPGIRSQLQRVRGIFEQERDIFVDGQRSGFAEFERVVSALRTDLEAKVRHAWRTYTTQKVPSLDAEVVRVLGSIPAYAGPVQHLRDHERDVAQLREALPDDSVCTRFEAAVEEIGRIWEEMRGGDFSSEVLRFLRSASTGGATLDLFTESVQQWLANHGLRDSFRITMAAKAGWR